MERNRYESAFSGRYASPEMQYLFSQDMKFSTWRRLWISLAKAEKATGLDISDEQIAELEAHATDINYEDAEAYEKKLRHDVMAHIHAYGDLCPKARAIIHLGATSCYVGDNTDMIIMKKALALVREKLLAVIKNLRDFADTYKALPALAYTHLQPAQLTTVGKRATLWLYELTLDLHDLDFVADSLALLGQKGTTGTQASFMELFEGDTAKIDKLEGMIAADFGFEKVVPVSGQTYSRKFDSRVMNVLSGIAQSAYKFANDMRILQSFKEMEEPFEKNQIGSSAMPYKRNPMRSERIASLARYVIADTMNPAMTASEQWFERTLDDSANRRISIPEAFLAVDGILTLVINIVKGMTVYPGMINRHLMDELPFIATENILMYSVKKGGDRQTLHEAIRRHSVAAAKAIKESGADNDLIDRIAADPVFNITKDEILKIIDEGGFTGRAKEQTEEYVAAVREALKSYEIGEVDAVVNV